MAENPLLPGTDIEVMEKYAPGKRLDFPDFGSVCKTTFVKGTITDFKVTADDPITVESMVKVTGGFGESEYIPLFYHPKALYWDGDGVLATDFDEETGAFKQAWQSFRGDDEVVVMLKEGIPVAVVGFADGVPRVGEDILKLQMADPPLRSASMHPIPWLLDPNPYFFQMSKKVQSFNDPYSGGDNGPDGKSLGLLKEVEASISDDEIIEKTFYGGAILSGAVGVYHVLLSKQYYKICVWPIVIGPIVYAIYATMEKVDITEWTYYADISGNYSVFLSWVLNPIGPPPVTGNLTATWEYPGTYYFCNYMMVKAGVSKEDLINEIKTSVNNGSPKEAVDIATPHNDWWPGAPEGIEIQTELTDLLMEDGQPLYDLHSYSIPDEFKWLVRPHTKAELEVAGMWPAV